MEPALGELWPTCQPSSVGSDDQVEEADKDKEGIVHLVHLLEDQDDHWQISGIFLEGHITTLWSLGHCVSSHFFFWFKRKRAGNTWVIFVIIWNLIWTIRKCLQMFCLFLNFCDRSIMFKVIPIYSIFEVLLKLRLTQFLLGPQILNYWACFVGFLRQVIVLEIFFWGSAVIWGSARALSRSRASLELERSGELCSLNCTLGLLSWGAVHSLGPLLLIWAHQMIRCPRAPVWKKRVIFSLLVLLLIPSHLLAFGGFKSDKPTMPYYNT